MCWFTFLEEVVAAVINAFPAVVGGNKACEGAEAGSEEDSEFDHFDGVVRMRLD